MYSNDNKNGFSILDLIVKIILAGLFIFILIWLFNKKMPNMKPFYSNVFRENIKYMQEAGENYFTDDRMPSEIGESRKLSLKEMIDSNLILPFVDEDGKECNTEESYVSITKLEEGYELKTNLVCPKETNYTLKMLGCHTYCAKGNCNPDVQPDEEKTCTTEKIKQYQFKKLVKKTSSTYSCASGYTLKGKYCYKKKLVDTKPAEQTTTTTRIDKIPATATVVDGKKISLTPVVKTNTDTANYNKVQLATQTSTSTESASYKKVQLTTQSSTGQESYSCTKYRDEKQCSTHNETRSYSCNCTSSVGPTGKTVTTCSTCYYTVPVETCRTVSTPYTGTCYRTTTTYSCPSGTTIKEGSGSSLKCYKTECPSGYSMSGSGTSTKCIKSTTTYSCPAEANLTEGSGENIKCWKVTEGSISYSCPKDYKLEGKECTKKISETSTKYECPSGYTLENKKCNKYDTEEKKATEKKVTTSKYEYKWSSKSSLSGWTATGKTRTINGKKTCK